MSVLENHTFDELRVGQRARYSKTLSEEDVTLFAVVSGDVNPVHLDADYAAGTPFRQRIAHGAWTGALISAALALELPGPGTIYLGQTLNFHAPVRIGDSIAIELEVTALGEDKPVVTLDCRAVNQEGRVVASGEARVLAPTERVRCPAPELPPVRIG